MNLHEHKAVRTEEITRGTEKPAPAHKPKPLLQEGHLVAVEEYEHRT